MTEPDNSIDRMSRAARTSLFDGVCDPDLMMGLVLSNLMSPALWDFRNRIEQRVDEHTPDHQLAIMKEIAHYVDGHFFHLGQHDISDIWGLVEIEAEAVGQRRVPVQQAVDLIMRHNAARVVYHGGDERRDLAPFAKKGLFPEYVYATLDIVHANQRILKRKKHKPYGITSCVDEAILIASLACVLDSVSARDIVLIGSPEHYTAFIHHQDRAFWLNGKHEFFDAEGWAQEVETAASGDAQAAFDKRLQTLDRVITPQGSFLLGSDRSSISPERWQSIRESLAQFFGVELRQIADACDKQVDCIPHELSSVVLAELDGVKSADDATAVLNELAAAYPGTAIEAAFYAFRRLDVRHPEAYVVAALREHKAREAAADLNSVDDAIAFVQAVEGKESVLGDRDRLVLPDEVLLLKTGSDRDKALLLYTLLHHAGIDDTAPELIFTDVDSYVRTGDGLISLMSLAACAATDGKTVFRHV